MNKANIQERVMAIRAKDDETILVYGYGAYEGDFIPGDDDDDPMPVGTLGLMMYELGHKDPKIRLENGQVIWGCECTWGPIEEVEKEIKTLIIEKADINDERREYHRQWG